MTSINLLTFAEARESPCMSCPSSPCCTHLNLESIPLDTVSEVDRALYLLNFEGIYMSLFPDLATARVFLHQPCRHLDPSGLCSVYRTEDQPALCAAYKAHECGYRRTILTTDSEESPLVDHARMLWLAEHMTFDEDRRVSSKPKFDDVIAAFRERPFERVGAAVPGPDPVREDWRQIVLGRKVHRPEPHLWSEPLVRDPCRNCAAWCCQTLIFERMRPVDSESLDQLFFSLGFPSVELKISDERWSIVVHTTCRHLEGGRCGLYGRPERPIACREYDEMACGYRKDFGDPQPGSILRVGLGQFRTVAESLVFDEFGRIVEIPPLAVLRQRLIEAERVIPSAT